MKKKTVIFLLTGCLATSPITVFASESTDISGMTLEELQKAYLELEAKYNALLEEEHTTEQQVNEGASSGAQTMESGGMIFTLNSVTQSASLPGYFEDETPEDPNNVFLVFDLEVQNTNEEDGYINMFYSAGYVDGYAIDPSTLLTADIETFAGDIAAGRNRAGQVVFEVPSDWSEFEYIYAAEYDNIDISFIVSPEDVTQE